MLDPTIKTDKELTAYIKYLMKPSHQVTILIIFWKVFEIYPSVKGGKYAPNFMKQILN